MTNTLVTVPLVLLLGCTVSGPRMWQVGTDSDWQSVAAGFQTTCAVKNGGVVWCWGRNDYGQIPGAVGSQKAPVAIDAPSTFTSVARPELGVCGHATDGRILCWGFGTHGDLGPDSAGGPGNTVRLAQQGTDWSSVTKGSEHTCAIRNGKPQCWGGNSWKELGDAFPYESASPLPILNVPSATVVDAFEHHTCALTAEKELWCWGGGNATGDDSGTGLDEGTPAKRISDDTDWKSLSTGVEFGVAIKEDGSLWQWGRFGRGEAQSLHRVGTGNDWLSASAGEVVACAIQRDHSLWCWGADDQDLLLGRGAQSEPVQLDDGKDWAHVSCGTAHTCALKNDGTLWCWGDDTNGEIGNGNEDE